MGSKRKENGTALTYMLRITPGLTEQIKAARERESKRIGIQLSHAAIVRRALELGLAQMEKVKP